MLLTVSAKPLRRPCALDPQSSVYFCAVGVGIAWEPQNLELQPGPRQLQDEHNGIRARPSVAELWRGTQQSRPLPHVRQASMALNLVLRLSERAPEELQNYQRGPELPARHAASDSGVAEVF